MVTDNVVNIKLQLCPGEPNVGCHREPIRCGIPWKQGVLNDIEAVNLCDPQANPVGCQKTVLQRWSDGSIRWMLLDWVANVGEQSSSYLLSRQVPAFGQDESRCRVTKSSATELQVDTGVAVFAFRCGSTFPLDSVIVDERAQLSAGSGMCLHILPTSLEPIVESVEVEAEGPVRVALRFLGSAGGLSLEIRLEMWAGESLLRCEVGLTNPQAAGHRNGWWGLGSKGHELIEDCSLTLKPMAADRVRVRVDPQTPPKQGCTVCVYQDSSGGENWNSPNHLNRQGRTPSRFRGYSLVCDGEESAGLRATPVGWMGNSNQGIAVASTYFWQNFPKLMEADVSRGLRFALFPSEFSDLYELQGGERKTHEIWFAFGADSFSALNWVGAPLIPVVDPIWCAENNAVPYLTPKSDDPHGGYCALVDSAIEGEDTFAIKRECIDEYGWRNFGDLYADHEAVFHTKDGPFISHYNNQYDPIAGCAIQFLRSGDARWRRVMNEMAWHVSDIDIYHTEKDKWAYNHGLFWHTNHYAQAGLATHRTFAPGPGMPGGGPSPEHLYASGLKLHYLMSGCPQSRQGALELGQYVIDADDGTRRIFSIIDRDYTGDVSSSGSQHYHGPGRAPGNSMVALMEAFSLTHDRKYLDKCEQLIRRCIHPLDDIQKRRLGDVEHRWFYMVFLHSLCKYLDLKEELGEIDQRFIYARESLLSYVRWAEKNEYPYLDRPELLDFPTETWAAQEMRKSEVFDRAGRFTAEEERDRFLERAHHFFQVSVTSLSDFATRTLSRPVVLLMSFGHIRAAFSKNNVQSAPQTSPSAPEFGEPVFFVSQKGSSFAATQTVGPGGWEW